MSRFRLTRRWVIALIVVVVAALAFREWVAWSVRRDIESMNDTISDLYRDEWIVCKGSMTRSCAREAADRIDLPVAWIPEGHADLSPTLMAAVVQKNNRGPIAVQELRGDKVLVSIQTTDRAKAVPGKRVTELRSGERRAHLWKESVENEDTFTIVWRTGDVHYSIGLVPTFSLSPVSPTREQAAAIFEAVEVTERR